MTTVLPALPDEIMALLRPAEELIAAEARDATRLAMLPVMVRKAKTAVRANGSGGVQYDIGAANALKRAFPGLVDARQASDIRLAEDGTVPAPVGSTEPVSTRTCQCVNCDDPECDADCEQCTDDDCEQCNPQCDGRMSCCGYCSEHGEHHGTEGGYDEDVRYSPSRSEPYCRDCDHWCDN